MSLSWVVRGLGAAAWVAIGACVLEADPDPGPCADVVCSDHAACEDGECRCDTGYLGDPYAAQGCTSTGTGGVCPTTCGLNAFCEESIASCICAEGFVAVCGTGDCLAESKLCDGTNDCINKADEQPEQCEVSASMTWRLWDACDDGVDAEFRLWADARPWVWPNVQETFVTSGFDVTVDQTLACVEGETICLGASAGDFSWGVGVDGSLSCADCCFPCADDTIEFGPLDCG